MKTHKELLALLHDHAQAKARAKATYAEIIRAAVECGLDQQEVAQTSCVDFLRGRLAAHGVEYVKPKVEA